MKARGRSVLCFFLLALIAAAALFAAEPGSRAPAPADLAAAKRTIADIRNVGTAMFAWYTDQDVAQRPTEDANKVTSVDIAAVPAISRQELKKILVPSYMADIPENDGWGNPYEFHLNTQDLAMARVMAIRSGGRDGVFSDDVYEVGAFAPGDFDQDVAWVDGFFVRWPEKPK